VAGIACALLEPGIDGAVAARMRGVDPVICARLEDVRMAPGSVRAAGMFDMSEPIEDEGGALRQVRALLRPGGLRTAPSLLGLRKPADAELQESEHVPEGFTARALDKLLDTEAQRIEAGGTIPFGTTCFAVCIED
jgi:hypothetical protein